MSREIAEWYVMISGARVGPLTRVELGLKLESGDLDGKSHVWKSGMAGWLHGAEVDELRSLFDPGAPPPPPGKPKPSSSPNLRAAKPGAVDPSATASRPGGNKPGALKPVMTVRSAGASTRAKPEAAPRLRDAYSAPARDEKGKGLKDLDTAHFRLAELNGDADSEKGLGAPELDTAHFRLAELDAQKAAMKKGGKGEGALELDTAHFRLAELDAQKEAMKKGGKGEGAVELDTAHFRLADLDAQKAAMKKGAKGAGVSEFDTGHFNLKDLDAQKAAMKKGAKGAGVSEFDTSHFRLSDLKKGGGKSAPQEALALDTDEAIHKPGVNSREGEAPIKRPASIAKPAPATPRPASISGAPRPASIATPRPASISAAPRPASVSATPRPPSAPGRPASTRLAQPASPERRSQPGARPPSRASSGDSGGSMLIYVIAGLAALGLIGAYLLLR